MEVLYRLDKEGCQPDLKGVHREMGLNEAGGKALDRQTETGYKTGAARERNPPYTKL
jgi:hypothetical protein